ncbi:MAG: SRPBCC family protein [Methyloceanibacter sp.]|uniref:SRPBCC family protein n=1 Tax=Methyloceanibacter sp. TaxID=1965321 RepID=UPI003EDF0DA3
MRVFKLTLVALAATFAWTAAAEAIEVKKRREAPGKPAEVWAVVGDFCAIKDWHPAVTECEQIEEGGDTFRILTLGDGGKIKEKLTDSDDTSYSYEIIEGPLPVKNYKATLEVGEDDEPDRVEIEWEAEFDADGVEDAEATKIISGIFNDGVTGIKKKAIAAYDKREPAAGNPVSKGRDRSEDEDLN